MWTTLALGAALSLAPAQAEKLTLSNARITYGELGTPRPEAKLLPGDIFFVAFDIEGIKVDEMGKVTYSMAMEVIDKDGKSIFKQQPVERKDFLPLGGNRLPARAYISIGLDQEPGPYTCKVTVTDLASKASQTLEQKFDVLKKDFGIVQVFTSCDDAGRVPAPTVGVAGESIWVHFALVGFDRDKTKKQPSITVEMAALTKGGQPAVPKPTTLTIDNVDEKESGIPLRFLLPLNREGQFTLELKATDQISKKTSKVTLPVTVIPAATK